MKPALRALLPSLGLIALVGCGRGGAPAPAAPPQVGTVTAEQQTVPLTRDLVGRLSAYFSANVVARVSGVLLKRVYKEGDEVKQGQLLFEIDPAYYQAMLNNNLAALAEDQATYINNRVTAERDHKLLPIGSVSQQTVDDADAAERSAAAKVQADQAAVETARINLGYTRVTSPIGGIAGQQQVTQGALVGNATSDTGSGGTLLTTVEQVDPLYVNFTISAADLVTLRQAQNVELAQQNDTTVHITLPNGSPYDQAGTLDFSDVAVNPTHRRGESARRRTESEASVAAGHVRDAEGHSRPAERCVPHPSGGTPTRHGRRLCVGCRPGRQGAAQERKCE